MRLILVRHGETPWNRENRVLGHSDIELSDNGRLQAERVGMALRAEKINAVYASPLKRTRETAEHIARAQGLEVITDRAFMELDAGELDGLTMNEVVVSHGEFIKEWSQRSISLKMPGGESIGDLQQRTWSAVERLLAAHGDETIVVVSHSLAIQSIVAKALGMELSAQRRLWLDLGSISVINFGPSGVSLQLYNDSCHLQSGV